MQWPFTGREAELRTVEEALASGDTGGVVIAGPAGVGKTRLLTEAAALAARLLHAVQWARATRSARSIPLGAFAALLPPTATPDGAELLARVRHALAEAAGDRRLVLCVDDGQSLDDTSAVLVHQLVAAGEAFAIVSVRRGDTPPDALRALWKDELCLVVDLDELTRPDVDAVLAAALGGPVDGPTANALWRHTRGNALFVRELVRHGLDRGRLTEVGGVWRWHGDVEAGARLADLVDLHVEDAGERGRHGLELVSVGAPLEAATLAPDEIAALEALELVERRTDGRRRYVDVAHPLHGEAVRAKLTPTRLESLHIRLADAVDEHGARRRGDLLRVAVWRLESGATGEAELFARAADQALAASDMPLTERLARAAVEGGAGFGARLALARALANTGRETAAQRMLADLEPAGDEQLAAVATAAARNLFWALDRADEADAVLRDAEQRVRDTALRDELAAQRVRFVVGQGRVQEALAAARPLLDDPAVGERARLTLALAAVEALFSMGRAGEAVTLAAQYVPAAERWRDDLPHAEAVLLGMRAMAQRVAGNLTDATRLSQDAYDALLHRRSGPGTAVEAASLALIWLARGRVRTALRFARESAALLRDADAVGMLAFSLAVVAQAAAQAGDAEAARAAVADMDATPLGHKAFAVELGLARAWGAAAGGELSAARAHALAAADLAIACGQDAYAARALHELARLGDAATAAPELARLGGIVDGPFARIAAAHAAALHARDGAALMDAAERFAAIDALLVAAEAATAAANALGDAGRPASARTAAARAAVWLEQCEDARPPTLLAAAEAAELTPREREIALLAASGASSRQIAGRLVISVRTVDNHLANAYRKLGVSRRQELGRVLSR